MTTASDVANYILSLANEDEELVSNMKLQKLLYYVQGFSLVILERPLFAEPISAWTYGPVVPEIYRKYKGFGAMGIPAAQDFDPTILSEEERALIDEVYQVYGQFSAIRLKDMTHNEPPWKNTLPNDVISHQEMKAFFETRVVESE